MNNDIEDKLVILQAYLDGRFSKIEEAASILFGKHKGDLTKIAEGIKKLVATESQRLQDEIAKQVEALDRKLTAQEQKKLDVIQKDIEQLFHMRALNGANNVQAILNVTNGGSAVAQNVTGINFTGSGYTLSSNATTGVVTVNLSTGGTGITRSILSISSNTIAAAASATDYVYLCSGAITLTLPTAVGNTNKYTIKNVGAATITVATTGGQTIDGGTNALLSVQYTAVDLESDGTNWNIT